MQPKAWTRRPGVRSAPTFKTLFDTYLERNVPDDDEELITVPRRGTPQRIGGDNTSDFTFSDFITDWRQLERVDRGEVETPAGDVRYVAVPVEANGETLGTFVVAIFVADEREQVDEAVQILALVSAAVLILGSIAAFSVVGRVLSRHSPAFATRPRPSPAPR